MIEVTNVFRDFVKEKSKNKIQLKKTYLNYKKSSSFIKTAQDLKNEIYEILNKIKEYNKLFIQNSNIFQTNKFEIEQQIFITNKISIVKENIIELSKILKEMDKKYINKQQQDHYNSIISNLFDFIFITSKKFEEIKKKSLDDLNFSKKLFDSNNDLNIENNDLLDFNENQNNENDLLEIENKNLKSDLSDLLSDIENVEKSAYEISSLMNQIQSKLGEDSEKIENIQKMSEETDENITDANENFNQIKDRSGSFFDYFFIYAFLFASLSILFLDLVN
eukprot:gene10198-2617_t